MLNFGDLKNKIETWSLEDEDTVNILINLTVVKKVEDFFWQLY